MRFFTNFITCKRFNSVPTVNMRYRSKHSAHARPETVRNTKQTKNFSFDKMIKFIQNTISMTGK